MAEFGFFLYRRDQGRRQPKRSVIPAAGCGTVSECATTGWFWTVGKRAQQEIGDAENLKSGPKGGGGHSSSSSSQGQTHWTENFPAGTRGRAGGLGWDVAEHGQTRAS